MLNLTNDTFPFSNNPITKVVPKVLSLVYMSAPNGSWTTRKQFANQMCVCVDGTVNLRCAICEPNVRMCGWDCGPVLRHLRTVHIPFAANWNLLVFCANTKRTGCAGCPFHAPGVLCSPQDCGKLINCAPLMHRMRTARKRRACVYKVLHSYS